MITGPPSLVEEIKPKVWIQLMSVFVLPLSRSSGEIELRSRGTRIWFSISLTEGRNGGKKKHTSSFSARPPCWGVDAEAPVPGQARDVSCGAFFIVRLEKARSEASSTPNQVHSIQTSKRPPAFPHPHVSARMKGLRGRSSPSFRNRVLEWLTPGSMVLIIVNPVIIMRLTVR